MKNHSRNLKVFFVESNAQAEELLNSSPKTERNLRVQLLDQGEKTWQLIMPNRDTRECFEAIYEHHDVEVKFAKLIHIDNDLIDIIFRSPPLSITLPALKCIDEQVFERLLKIFSSSNCYNIYLPSFKFTDAHRIQLVRRGLTLQGKGNICNSLNIERADARDERTRKRKENALKTPEVLPTQ